MKKKRVESGYRRKKDEEKEEGEAERGRGTEKKMKK